MFTSSSVSVRHVSNEFAYLDSSCFVKVYRYVKGICTGCAFFDISGDYLDLQGYDFKRLCKALGKRLRLSGGFVLETNLKSGTEDFEVMATSWCAFDGGDLVAYSQNPDFSIVVL